MYNTGSFPALVADDAGIEIEGELLLSRRVKIGQGAIQKAYQQTDRIEAFNRRCFIFWRIDQPIANPLMRPTFGVIHDGPYVFANSAISSTSRRAFPGAQRAGRKGVK